MDIEELRKAWQKQSTVYIGEDLEKAMEAVRAAEKKFDRRVFWRDVRESFVALALAAGLVWLGHSVAHYLWPYYAAAACCCWIAAFLVVDRRIQRDVEPATTTKAHLDQALRKVDHQIALLRNVAWWYMLPCTIAFMLIIGEAASQIDDWGQAYPPFAITLGLAAILFPGVYWLNQYAVKSELMPMKEGLEKLRRELDE